VSEDKEAMIRALMAANALSKIIKPAPSTSSPPDIPSFLRTVPTSSPPGIPSIVGTMRSALPPPNIAPFLGPVPSTSLSRNIASILETAPIVRPEIKRRVYFAFDFDDLIRVNNVRQIGKVGPREQRNARTFLDRSIWESRDITKDPGLKTLMRNAVQHSSVVCALVGTNTWRSRWAKYEIARAVIDERGLVAIHLNGIKHHVRKTPDRPGISPLHVMGIYHSTNGTYYLAERHPEVSDRATGKLDWVWRLYEDHKDPVPLPRYIPSVEVDRVVPLSPYTAEYDMMQDGGYQNIGGWLDAAAIAVNR